VLFLYSELSQWICKVFELAQSSRSRVELYIIRAEMHETSRPPKGGWYYDDDDALVCVD